MYIEINVYASREKSELNEFFSQKEGERTNASSARLLLEIFFFHAAR